MGPDTVIRAAGGIALVPLTVYAAVREVPRLTAALAELAADDGPIGRAAELKVTEDGLVAPGGQLEDLSGIGPSLERLVTSLERTIGPLQGTTERLGRLVDRLPGRRRDSEELAAPASQAGD